MYSQHAVWRRALRRVDRRSALLQQAEHAHPELVGLTHITREGQLLREAVRTANRLAPIRDRAA